MALEFERVAGWKGRSGADGATPAVKIATTGNCQSAFIASVLNSIPGVQAEYFGKQTRWHPFDGKAAPINPVGSLVDTLRGWKDAGANVILCEQVWPVADAQTIDDISFVDGLIRFPNVEAYCLWPEGKYSESHLSRLMPSRLIRLDVASVKTSEAKANVILSDVYDGLFRKEVPFDSGRHPTPVFFALILERLFASEGFSALKFDQMELLNRVKNSRGLNTAFNHPIAPHIAEELRLEWAHTRIYKRWGEATALQADKDPAALDAMLEIAAFESDDPLFSHMIEPFRLVRLASLLWQSGDRDASMAARAQVIELDPFNTNWRYQLASFQLATREPEAARQTLLAASEFVPMNARMMELLADAEISLGEVHAGQAKYAQILAEQPKTPSTIRREVAFKVEAAATALRSCQVAENSENWSAEIEALLARVTNLADSLWPAGRPGLPAQARAISSEIIGDLKAALARADWAIEQAIFSTEATPLRRKQLQGERQEMVSVRSDLSKLLQEVDGRVGELQPVD